MEKLVCNLSLRLGKVNMETVRFILVILAIALFVLGAGAPGTPGDVGVRIRP